MSIAPATDSLLFVRHLDGTWFVGWGQPTRVAELPLDKPAFYLPDFFLRDQKPWWVPREFHRMTTPELTLTWPALKKEQSRFGWSWYEPDESFFNEELQD